MATQAQLNQLRQLISGFSSDGFSDQEGKEVVRLAERFNISPATIAQMSGVDESAVRDGIQNLKAGSSLLNMPSGRITNATAASSPPATNVTIPAGFDPIGGENVQVQQTLIPEFLKPFLQDSTNLSTGALAALANQLQQPNALVTPLNGLQNESLAMQAALARGEGGFLPNAINTFNRATEGAFTEQIDPTLSAMSQLGRADGISSLEGGLSNVLGRSLGSLDQIASGGNLPSQVQQGVDTLSQTASGDFLFGNSGFDAAVQASIDAATPRIASTFSRAGPGGLKSGLAQSAIQEAASNAFAQQFGQERANQLNASGTLGDLFLGQQGQQLGAANALGGLGLGGANTVGGLRLSQQGQNLNALNSLSGFIGQGINTQLGAASQLPELGLMGPQLLGQIGGIQQAQNEKEKLGAVQQNQQLLQSAFGNLNPASLLGSSGSSPQQSGGALGGLGGALTGFKLGSKLLPQFGPVGGIIGAIGGGVLGAR